MKKFFEIHSTLTLLFTLVIMLILLFIFAQIDAKFFPNSIILLILSLLIIAIPAMFLKTLPKKWKFYIIIISFIFACLNWVFVSYNSFYDGVEFNLENEANILYTTSSTILNSHIPYNKKKEFLENIYSKSYAEITLEKDNNPFIFIESKRSKETYELKTIIDSKTINTDNGIYNFRYSYANQPFLSIGLTRAISFSVFPDILINGLVDNSEYIKGRLYNRSITLWSVFIALSWLFLFILNYKTQLNKKQKQIAANQIKIANYKDEILKGELEITNLKNKISENKEEITKYKEDIYDSKVELANFKEEYNNIINNIAEMHQLLHIKMLDDINNITTSKVKNTLQALLTNWSFKHSLEEKNNIENANAAITQNINSKIHDFKNDFTTYNDFYQNNQKELQSYISEILEALKEIPKIITLKLQNYSISDILDKISENPNLNGSKRQPRDLVITYTPIPHEAINPNYKCYVSLEQLKSIVKNLIENSQTATEKQKNKLRSSQKKFLRKILVETNITDNYGKKYFTISVRDNGGGFPEPDKIYKEPVISTTEKLNAQPNRKGDGTIYIKYYVEEIFNGKIKARNYECENNLLGAETIIYFPIITD